MHKDWGNEASLKEKSFPMSVSRSSLAPNGECLKQIRKRLHLKNPENKHPYALNYITVPNYLANTNCKCVHDSGQENNSDQGTNTKYRRQCPGMRGLDVIFFT